MTQEQKKHYQEICKDILLKHVADGRELPTEYQLHDQACAQYNKECRLDLMQECLNEARKSSKLASILINNHQAEAFRLAETLAPVVDFYYSDTKEVLNEFKAKLNKYATDNAEIKHD